jgi:hypothetical protein
MKKILPILFAIALVSMAASCSKTATPEPIVTNVLPGSLELNFKAVYAARPLVIGQVYDYNSKKIKFSKIQFFMAYEPSSFDSPVSNSPSQTSLVKFSNLTDSASAATGVFVDIALATKDWTGMNFGIGVPQAANAKLPKDFSFPSGLADSDNFWDSWQSYIFTKLEAKIDANNDGIFETNITLHTGSNEIFSPIKLVKNFAIKNNATTKAVIEVNVNEWVKTIDLATVNLSHNLGEISIMKKISANLSTTFTAK